MEMNSNRMEQLERTILDQSSKALSNAYQEALDNGLSVYVSASTPHGTRAIYEVFPNGKRELRKELDPPLQILAGTTVKIP